MRLDEKGQECPATLGEYRDVCVAFGGENTAAVRLLDRKIASVDRGRDEPVIKEDSQMRALLMPLLLVPVVPAEPEPPDAESSE